MKGIGTKRKKEKGIALSLNKKKKKEEESPWFPSEVITDILSRLPAKSVLKFRCVCKSWNSIITADDDRYLVARHLENRIRHPNSSDGVLSLRCTRQLKYSDCVGDRYFYYVRPALSYSVGDDYSGPVEFDISEAVQEEEEEEQRYISITNSCDGLVGVFGLRNFYVANPSIGRLASLPRQGQADQHLERLYDRSSIPEAGIGLDASTGQYKAVRLFQYYRSNLRVRGTGCEVCTLGGAAGSHWKLVGDAPFRPYEIGVDIHGSFRLPVLVDGIIHWTVLHTADRGQKPQVAVTFNLRDERFDVILHPEGSSRPMLSRVAALAGRLCVADTPYSTLRMKIWVLEDYKKREWVKLYDINLTQMPRCVGSEDQKTVPVTIRRDGLIVLFDRQGRRDYYDPQTGKFVVCEIFEGIDDLHLPYKTGVERLVTYTDSLVWPWPTVNVPSSPTR